MLRGSIALALAVRARVWHELPLFERQGKQGEQGEQRGDGQDFQEVEPQDELGEFQPQDFRTAVASSGQAFAESLRSSAADWLDYRVDHRVEHRVEAAVAAAHEEQRAE